MKFVITIVLKNKKDSCGGSNTMNSIGYIIHSALIVSIVLHASEEQTQSIMVERFANRYLSIPIKIGDTHQKLIHSLNAYFHFAQDITYEHFENGKYYTINPKETMSSSWFDAQNAKSMRPSRYWRIEPQGTLLKSDIHFTIRVNENENIKKLKEKIKLFIIEQKHIQPNEYCIIQITRNGRVLSDHDLMPSYRKEFKAKNYTVTINKVDPQPRLFFMSDMGAHQFTPLMPKKSFMIINIPSNIKLYALSNIKNPIDISTIKIEASYVKIDNNNTMFTINVYDKNKLIESAHIEKPSQYACYNNLMATTDQSRAYNNNFNDPVCQKFYTMSKELLSLWANTNNYLLTENTLPVPVALSTDRTIKIEGSGDQMIYNATIDLNASQSLENVIKMYKKLTDLADDITVTIYDQRDIDQSNPITNFTNQRISNYKAKLSRSWNINLQEVPFGVQIKSLNINLEEKQSIGSIKHIIKEDLFLKHKIPKETLHTLIIAKDGMALADSDTMPLYVEPFDPSHYAVK